MKSWVHVELMGGLGNQLFQYYAALSVANDFQIPLAISDRTRANHKSIHRNSEIFSLASIEGARTKSSQIGDFLFWSSKISYAILRRSRLLTRVAASRGFITDPYLTKLKLSNLNLKKFHLKGYFQTYKNFESCSTSQKNLSIDAPSTWYRDLEVLISGGNSVAVHIRRGDYNSMADTFGVLSIGYYKRAINLVTSAHPNADFYVFSDDIHAAREMLSDFEAPPLTYVEHDDELNVAESLLLMSKCKIVVTANSTFSYWGALLGDQKKMVIFPDPWLRSSELKCPETPGDWTSITSEFIS
ncbi:Fut1_Fut2_like domain containing protein [Candidatus Nanopelagicaceae bacterium]